MAEIPIDPAVQDVTLPPVAKLSSKAQLIFVACVMIIAVAAMIAAILLTFQGSGGDSTKTFFTILLYCFACMTVSCIIFTVRAEAKGTLVAFGIMLGGSAAAWIVAFGVCSYFFQLWFKPSDTNVLDELLKMKRKAEIGDSIDYASWRDGSLGKLKSTFESQEDTTVANLLSAPYRADHPALPVESSIQEAYLYLDYDHVIGIERIRGKGPSSYKETDLPTQVYGTSPGNVVSSGVFSFDDDTNALTYIKPTGTGWIKAPQSFDVVILADWKNDSVKFGDFVTVQTRRMGTTAASEEIVALSPHEWDLQNAAVWRVKTVSLAADDQVPLFFQKEPGAISLSPSVPDDFKKSILSVIDGLKTDQSDPDGTQLLAAISKEISDAANGTSANVFSAPAFKYQLVAIMPSESQPTITLMPWKKEWVAGRR